MSVLEIKNLTHMFDGKKLFADATLNINNGEHLGIVGLNGAGKSTFINIIAGNLLQDSGEVKWLSGIRWGYLDQHANIDRSKTIMEYLRTAFAYLDELNQRMEAMYDQMATAEGEELDSLINRSANIMNKLVGEEYFDLDSNIKKVANGLGIHNFGYDTLISKVSGGQRAKLVLAKLLLEKLDIMLLDEPTNFLDIEHISWLVGYLNEYEGTIMVISHDTEFLNKVCKGVVSIENGIIRKYSGDYNSYLEQREQNAKQYADSYERQQREIEKMETYIAKNKARAATAGMANSRKKMLERIEVMDKPTQALEAHFSFPYDELHTKDMLIVKNLQIGYSSPLLAPIDLHINSQDKVWIRGTNGIGKSTLIKTLLSRIRSLGGSFHFHIATKTNYLEQDLEFRNTNQNGILYISDMFPRFNQKAQRDALAKVGIKGDLATRPICNLSGGEQVRIRLAVLMNISSNILILDEPTNHLDILAKNSLKKALQEYPGAIILVSHETAFAQDVCNKTVDFKI